MIYLFAALAAYYLALSISREDGPFELFKRLRDQFTNDDWIGRGVRCVVCVSAYTGLLVALILWATGQTLLSDVPILWFGLAGASVVIDRYWKR